MQVRITDSLNRTDFKHIINCPPLKIFFFCLCKTR